MKKSSNATIIAYSSVCASLSTMSVVLGAYIPIIFSFLPMIVCPLSFFVVFYRFGWLSGFVCIIATGVLCFFLLGGMLVTFLEFVIIIAPYSVLVVLIDKLDYSNKKALLRALIVTAFSIATTLITFLLFYDVFDYQAEFDATGAKLFFIVAILMLVANMACDILYLKAAKYIHPKILKIQPKKPDIDLDNIDIFD